MKSLGARFEDILYFEKKMEAGKLPSEDTSCYIKFVGTLGARDAVMTNRSKEKLAESEEVLELPFEVRD
ncbi:hypothetical protein N8920_02120 [Opitutales bacterium]|nr:hypothetical protein [Opitutales bacterium]